jgi:uncharacterized protein
VARKRISLSLKELQKRDVPKKKVPPAKPEPVNAFQSKLMELKKKFKD